MVGLLLLRWEGGCNVLEGGSTVLNSVGRLVWVLVWWCGWWWRLGESDGGK